MKKLVILTVFLTYTSYAQKPFDIIKNFDTHIIEQLKDQVIVVSNYDIEDNKYSEKDSTAISNLKLFLDNPFDLRIKKFNLPDALKTLERLAERIKIADSLVPGPGVGIDYTKILKNDIFDIIPGLTANDSASSSSAAMIPTGASATTYFINVLSQFILDRTKEELTLTFYENFKTKLETTISFEIQVKDPNTPIKIEIELKKLFENTYLMFESKNYFESPSFGQTWLLAFKKDLMALPFKIEENLKYNNAFKGTSLGHFALLSFDIVTKTKKGQHPMRILEDLAQTYQLKATNSPEIDQIIALLNLFSQNLKTDVEENGLKVTQWISSLQLENLNDTATKYLLGVIYQEGRRQNILQNINLGSKGKLEALINEKNTENFHYFIKTTLNAYNLIEQQLEAVKSIKKETEGTTEETAKSQLKRYTDYLNSFYLLIDETFEHYYSLFDTTSNYQTDYYEKYRPIATDIAEFNTAIGNVNYAECLLLTIRFIKHLANSEKTKDNDALNKITFYGNFMIDVISASENKGDIKAIIENYALPVSSYRIKRTHYTSWDVAAYPGLYLSYEFSGSNSLSYGITAPIGISFSYNCKQKIANDRLTGSFTTFFSVIDIGAPFSYRFNNDEAQGLPENIKWEQVFSPGLFLIYGLPNTPVSFGVNAQFAPLLRKIDTGNELETKNIFRVGLSVLVDIPLFNLRKVENKKLKPSN